MRRYIRHPSDVPIEYTLVKGGTRGQTHLKNISHGGLCFHASAHIAPGSTIQLRIPVRDPAFKIRGTVLWCRKTNDEYDVGVEFPDARAEFTVRMVEQVCHIEHFKKQILEKERRRLSGQEACIEWIERYAKQFPR